MSNSIPSSDLTVAEIKALSRAFYAAPDRASGLWNVIIRSFQYGFQKAQESHKNKK